MYIKVCGMKNPQNITSVTQLPVDIIGLIFYEKSARYVGKQNNSAIKNAIPKHVKTAGVFVNDSLENIFAYHSFYSFSYIQLHGTESPEFCEQVQQKTNAQVIKAFQVDADFLCSSVSDYEQACSYALFDTKTKHYGGSGHKFDWEKLSEYSGKLPFFLSGGITPCDADIIKSLQLPLLYAIDINSKFEIEPGLKNTEEISLFIKELQG